MRILPMTIKYSLHHSPNDCNNIDDVRNEIDKIDYTIIKLLAHRFEYVKATSQFKKNATDVQAKARFNSMLDQRMLWATELGLDGEVIKELFANLVKYFINEEMKHFNNGQKN